MQSRPENDLVYLLLILEGIGKIFLYSLAFEDALEFYRANDQLNFNASLLLLAQIGEQSGKISIETKRDYSLIEWKQTKNLRNRIVHDYTGIDFDLTFHIIKDDLSILQNHFENIIANGLMKGIFIREEFETARVSAYYRHVNFPNILNKVVKKHGT